MGWVAQSVQRLATGWTVRGSNPSGGRDFPNLSRLAPGPNQPPAQWVWVFPGVKGRPGRDADPSPPSSAVVKKGQSYTSTPPMGRMACTEPQCLYKGALYLTFTRYFVHEMSVKHTHRHSCLPNILTHCITIHPFQGLHLSTSFIIYSNHMHLFKTNQ